MGKKISTEVLKITIPGCFFAILCCIIIWLFIPPSLRYYLLSFFIIFGIFSLCLLSLRNYVRIIYIILNICLISSIIFVLILAAVGGGFVFYHYESSPSLFIGLLGSFFLAAFYGVFLSPLWGYSLWALITLTRPKIKEQFK